MDIGLHYIKRVMVDEVHQLGGGTYICNLQVVTDDGRVSITLFSDAAAKLEIVKVKDINDFYDSEPAT